MSTKPKTIDNLGVEASIRYAQDREIFDARYIEESKLVAKRVEIPVAKPYIPSEIDFLVAHAEIVSWAAFQPPPEYFTSASAVFSHQVIPSFGEYEKQEADSDKLAFLEEAIARRRTKGKAATQEEEQERSTIAKLFNCIGGLDKNLSLINARRNQYQRG